MSKDQVKQAPDYDPDRHVNDEPDYHEDVGSYYEPYGWHGPSGESFRDAEAERLTDRAPTGSCSDAGPAGRAS